MQMGLKKYKEKNIKPNEKKKKKKTKENNKNRTSSKTSPTANQTASCYSSFSFFSHPILPSYQPFVSPCSNST